jgi:hypothetical protein
MGVLSVVVRRTEAVETRWLMHLHENSNPVRDRKSVHNAALQIERV